MKPLLRHFTDHPESVGETYGQHLVSATGFSLRMIGAGIACLIHAVLPFLFVCVGSNTIDKLHERMIRNRARQAVASLPDRPAGAYVPGSKALPTP